MHKDDFNQINGYARKFGFAWFIATLFMHQKRAKAIWNQGNEKKNIVPQYVEAAKDALEKSFIRSTGSNESNVFHRCSSMVMNYPGETKYLMTVADCYGVMNVVKAFRMTLGDGGKNWDYHFMNLDGPRTIKSYEVTYELETLIIEVHQGSPYGVLDQFPLTITTELESIHALTQRTRYRPLYTPSRGVRSSSTQISWERDPYLGPFRKP